MAQPGTPPPRPSKSKLRTLISSDDLESPRTTPDSSPKVAPMPDTPRKTTRSSSNPPSRPVSVVAAHQSRFTEHFDESPPADILAAISNPVSRLSRKKSKRPKRLTMGLRFPQSPSSTVESPRRRALSSSISPADTPTSPIVRLKRSLSTSNNLLRPNSSVQQRPALTPSLSASLIDSRLSVISDNTSLTSRITPPLTVPTLQSTNRADIIICRLENWMRLLKTVVGWLDESSKIYLLSSRCHYERVMPLVKGEFEPGNAAATIHGGLKLLTIQLAGEHRDVAKKMKEHLLILNDFKKECKDKIRNLKQNQSLYLDDLLKRADLTRKSIQHLSKCCTTVQETKGPTSYDPWLANLCVLRHLKREVDEENRLRLLMLPIQRDLRIFEQGLIQALKPAVQYCYQMLSPRLWDGTIDHETAPFRLIFDQINEDAEWNSFAYAERKELVDERKPIKDYLHINYQNKNHPSVMCLQKSRLERQFGVRKQFSERYFVLSQGGYLHQFRLQDNVLPERTLFIPDATFEPLAEPQQTLTPDAPANEGYIFKIHVPSVNVLQRVKTYVFRAFDQDDYIHWCRVLSQITRRNMSGDSGIVTSMPHAHYALSLESVSEEDENAQRASVEGELGQPLEDTKSTTSTSEANIIVSESNESQNITSTGGTQEDDDLDDDEERIPTPKRFSTIPITSHQLGIHSSSDDNLSNQNLEDNDEDTDSRETSSQNQASTTSLNQEQTSDDVIPSTSAAMSSQSSIATSSA